MKWFNYSEFDSPDQPGSGNLMDIDFLEMLDEARSRAGIPFVISSGYRSEEHNFDVGGTANSSHMKGCAADIVCATKRDRFLIVSALLESGFDRIGIGEDFVHCDCDWEKPSNVIWTYP
jgi:zinc D-Ala-D-Ala carboxypeptidase